MDLHIQKIRNRFKNTFNWSRQSIFFLLFCLLFCELCVSFTKFISKTDGQLELGSEASEEAYSKAPSITWYNTIISTTEMVSGQEFWEKERRLACYNGSQLFKCRIYPHESHINADGYIFYGSALQVLPVTRRNGRIWGLFHEESPVSRCPTMTEEVLSHFNYSATFSRHSDQPAPLLWFRGLDVLTSKEYFVNTSAKNSLEIAPVMYLQSNCGTFTGRDEYVTKLMEYIKIDSYGYCVHNRELPLDPSLRNTKQTGTHFLQLYREDLLRFMAKYKFIIAVENAVCYDYVTEKLWRSLELGVVPIYYGSPLIRDWLPNNKSAILLEDFPTPELLSQHLHYLLNNDTAYEEYLEHKTLGLVSNQRILEELTARPYQTSLGEAARKFECFICEKLHNRDSGVNIIDKSHYNCSLPTSALTLSLNPNSPYLKKINEEKLGLD